MRGGRGGGFEVLGMMYERCLPPDAVSSLPSDLYRNEEEKRLSLENRMNETSEKQNPHRHHVESAQMRSQMDVGGCTYTVGSGCMYTTPHLSGGGGLGRNPSSGGEGRGTSMENLVITNPSSSSSLSSISSSLVQNPSAMIDIVSKQQQRFLQQRHQASLFAALNERLTGGGGEEVRDQRYCPPPESLAQKFLMRNQGIGTSTQQELQLPHRISPSSASSSSSSSSSRTSSQEENLSFQSLPGPGFLNAIHRDPNRLAAHQRPPYIQPSQHTQGQYRPPSSSSSSSLSSPPPTCDGIKSNASSASVYPPPPTSAGVSFLPRPEFMSLQGPVVPSQFARSQESRQEALGATPYHQQQQMMMMRFLAMQREQEGRGVHRGDERSPREGEGLLSCLSDTSQAASFLLQQPPASSSSSLFPSSALVSLPSHPSPSPISPSPSPISPSPAPPSPSSVSPSPCPPHVPPMSLGEVHERQRRSSYGEKEDLMEPARAVASIAQGRGGMLDKDGGEGDERCAVENDRLGEGSTRLPLPSVHITSPLGDPSSLSSSLYNLSKRSGETEGEGRDKEEDTSSSISSFSTGGGAMLREGVEEGTSKRSSASSTRGGGRNRSSGARRQRRGEEGGGGGKNKKERKRRRGRTWWGLHDRG